MRTLLNKLRETNLSLGRRKLVAVDFDSRELRIVRLDRRGGREIDWSPPRREV